jgi:hypothetical protein
MWKNEYHEVLNSGQKKVVHFLAHGFFRWYRDYVILSYFLVLPPWGGE